MSHTIVKATNVKLEINVLK